MLGFCSLYGSARRLLFLLDAERAHDLTITALSIGGGASGWLRDTRAAGGRPRQVFGLTFPNAVGLAAGLDKNADAIDGLGALGFGHVEVGTVTPRPQPGNPQPRLFRVPEAMAIVNRMGFNNHGVEHVAARLGASRFPGIRGVNIGKNFDTPLERAHEDYLACFEKLAPLADYVVVNVSSPNTAKLRELQADEGLRRVFEPLLASRPRHEERRGRRIPLLVKIAPDLSDDELESVARTVRALGLDGIVATNTTISRDGLPDTPVRNEAGGMSGAPLTARSRAVVAKLRALVGPELPIIGVGGIMTGDDAQAMVAAGATLVQIYTGFIYRGPELIGDVVARLG